MRNIFNYVDRPSPIHRLTGATKLVCLLLWSFAAMSTYDTRLLVFLTLLSLVLFALSRIRFSDVSFLVSFMAAFMVLNNVLIFVFSPQHGVTLYGSSHPLLSLGGQYVITREQLFYHLNLVLKYFATIPIVLLFVCTTNPSEFAASLNRIGIRYTVAYSVALALRYIPDIQKNYHEISQAQQARGIEMSRKQNLVKRLKSAAAILIPLILSSMDRIEVVSNAMELRGFGKGKKRTWYMGRPFRPADILAMVFCALLLAAAIALNVLNGGRFWNPFR
ncbi:MAG: energy-coupling factor transporter transmembrane protein EcfT [Oscillospiraceae bacterium]|jgi:energy-coupling factor transport system permease protein|nr:energy-coupling factor transporter transmembrane protein EcfT [Oscillospiraceae bacterium]